MLTLFTFYFGYMNLKMFVSAAALRQSFSLVSEQQMTNWLKFNLHQFNFNIIIYEIFSTLLNRKLQVV